MGYKNTITIEIDTDSKDPIVISKPETIKQPETVQETIDMMSVDFKTLCLTICEMVFIGDANGYFNGQQVLNTCIEELNEFKIKLDNNSEESE